jgi:hypothetical protein
MKLLCALSVLCGFAFPALAQALDREAFTFTDYVLNVQIEPEQQRLGVRGHITLRNDSQSPQKNLSLQISSTLHWSSIQLDGKPVDFTSQAYTSDIDHTGALTEAIVTLSRAVAPKETLQLEIGYEGTIPLDATRLTRIGAPAEVARHSDWDQISPAFTGLRGIGYVAWYPIATEAANLSEGSSVLEEIDRWKRRESQATMKISLCLSGRDTLPTAIMNDAPSGVPGSSMSATTSGELSACRDHSFPRIAQTVPALIVATLSTMEQANVRIHFLPDHKSGAENYALAVEETVPFIDKWFGEHKSDPGIHAQVVDLPDPEAEPFESGSLLLMPLNVKDSALLLSALQQLTHIAFPSPRSWIYDGLAHYAQLGFLQERGGRTAVLGYLESHRDSLLASEKQIKTGNSNQPAEHSLINSSDEFYVEAKAMNVWWMLRDIVGETALHAALHNYQAADDKDAYYMQKLIEAQAHRDLAWFFDDWVYRDRGLPDFRIVSVYPRELLSGGYMVTVLVENLGEAAAEVPVTAHMDGKEASARLIILGKSKTSVRIQSATMPQEVTVNDGSVPETDTSNNSYKIEATAAH